MASGNIGHVEPYTEATDYDSYMERVEQFMIANDIADEKKVATFLTLIGPQCYQVLRDILAPAKASDKSYEDLKATLRAHYKPTPMIISERFKFYKRDQQSNEDIAAYCIVLKQLAATCDFGTFLDQALRDRLVCGLKNEGIQRKLLTDSSDKAMTFAQGKAKAQSMEAAQRHVNEFNRDTSVSVNRLFDSKGQYVRRDSGKQIVNSAEQRPKCTRCLGKHSRESCRFKSYKCNKCQEKGHLARACSAQSKDTYFVEEESETVEDDFDLMGIFQIDLQKSKTYSVDIVVAGHKVSMDIDTGAAVSVIPVNLYKRYLSHYALMDSKVKLRTYGGEEIVVLGVINVPVATSMKESYKLLPLVVVQNNSGRNDLPPLLGRNWLAQLKLNWSQIFSINADNSELVEETSSPLQEILNHHKPVFESGLGKIKGFKANIILTEAKPIFYKARSVPYALKERLKNELDRMEKAKIISKVADSEWSSPIVVVPKSSGAIRVCGDYKVTINQHIVDDKYPLPNTTDLFSRLAGGQQFSKLDLSHAYNQLELDESSRKYLTINTPFGLYAHSRLSFGVSTAPAQFQRVMDTMLQGLDGVLVI